MMGHSILYNDPYRIFDYLYPKIPGSGFSDEDPV